MKDNIKATNQEEFIQYVLKILEENKHNKNKVMVWDENMNFGKSRWGSKIDFQKRIKYVNQRCDLIDPKYSKGDVIDFLMKVRVERDELRTELRDTESKLCIVEGDLCNIKKSMRRLL